VEEIRKENIMFIKLADYFIMRISEIKWIMKGKKIITVAFMNGNWEQIDYQTQEEVEKDFGKLADLLCEESDIEEECF
jgi:hypothetical protein